MVGNLYGDSMERNSIPEMGQSGEADRRSRVFQEALWISSIFEAEMGGLSPS